MALTESVRGGARPQPWLVKGDVDGFFGFIHAGELTPNGSIYDIAPGSGLRWAVAYLLCAGLFVLFRPRAQGPPG